MANRKSRKPSGKTASNKQKSFVFPIHYIIISVLAGIFIYFTTQVSHIQDDAFITFRYVDNFIHGKGLVFNQGEFVEGFTSFFFVMMLSVIAILKSNLPEISQYISIGSGVIALFVTYRINNLLLKSLNNNTDNKSKISNFGRIIDTLFQVAPSILLTFTGAFVYWSVSGMEASFYIMLVLISIYYYIEDIEQNELNYKFAVFSLLATLTRPEGAFIFGLIMIHFIVKIYFGLEKKSLAKIIKKLFARKNLYVLGIVIVPNILLLIFRLVYYGYPFPNTFYAKAGISSVYLDAGLDYFIDFIKSYLLYGTLLILPFILFKLKNRIITSLFYLIIIANLIYIVLIGGDVLPMFRFFLPVLPLIYILFTATLFYFYKTGIAKVNPKLIGVIGILIILGTSYYNYTYSQAKIERLSHLEVELVKKMKGSADWLVKQQLLMKRKLVVAATTIGALSYYSKVTIIDMLGLTDSEIAHNPKYIEEISGVHAGWKERKYNVDYVLSRNPDYIFFSTGIKPSAYAERALFINENFINYYYPYFFKIWPGLKYVETIYKRRVGKINFVKFSANPNYNDDYVHLYNRILNMKGDKNNADKIIELCNELIKEAPLNFADSYRLLGSAYEKKGDNATALKVFEKAFEIDPTNGPANIKLLFKYRKMGDTRNAIKHYVALKDYNPTVLSLYGIK